MQADEAFPGPLTLVLFLGVFPHMPARFRGIVWRSARGARMYNTPAVVTLRENLACQPCVDAEALHDEVCAVVDELKGANWPPERIIVAVKRIADDAGLRPSRNVLYASGELSLDDALLVQMIRWCIERYYRAD